MNRVVIIGGSGFVGKRLEQFLLQKKVSVVSLSSKECDLLSKDCGSKLKTILLDGDIVVFASALTPDKGKDEHAFMKNISMVYSFAAVLAQKKIAHLVYISSDTVYGDEVNPITENTPATAPSFYGMAHRAREMILESVTRTSQIPYVILRPCALYGSGDTHNSYGPNRFLKSARETGVISLFGAGEEKRDHLFIDDFCSIIFEAIVAKKVGILNACTGTSISFYEVALQIQRYLGTVSIQPSERSGSIIHRHFDALQLRQSLPSVRITPFADSFFL